jgi:hypothetical protein
MGVEKGEWKQGDLQVRERGMPPVIAFLKIAACVTDTMRGTLLGRGGFLKPLCG